MANNYVLFSEGLRVTAKDVAWIKAEIDKFENAPTDEDSDEYRGFLGLCEEYEVEPDIGLEFQVEYYNKQVIFYSEEGGNWYHVAKLVQNLFRAHYPDAAFTIGWAETCSRPRPGEFGGGGAVVTAEKIEAMSTWKFFDKVLKKRDRRNE